MDKIFLSQAVVGYDIAAKARHLSEHTLADYYNTFRKFQAYLGYDPDITQKQIEIFLGSLKVSKKTVLNYHTGLSALWEWAVETEKMIPANILHDIERPKPEKPDIIPYTESEVRLLLSTLSQSKPYITHGSPASHNLFHAERNRAIILILLDTGLRASELCDLRIRDVDMRSANKYIKVIHGKGDKSRHIPVSPRTAQSVWKYLTGRQDTRISDPLFVTRNNYSLDRTNLGDILLYAGNRAGVTNCHPHRFRHTFAINFLRNGGNIYTLQSILGHELLKTCLVYLKIAETDIESAHRMASPVDNWRL